MKRSLTDCLILRAYWDSTLVDKHRRGLTDCEWASKQPNGKPNYFLGDIVEFKVGGFGIITETTDPGDKPIAYSISSVQGLKQITTGKCAWHYEGDFKRLVGKSPIRNLPCGRATNVKGT